MSTQRLGLIMNGITGRMGLNQHLIRSIVAIRNQGGVRLANGDRVMPDPILVGRDATKVEQLVLHRAMLHAPGIGESHHVDGLLETGGDRLFTIDVLAGLDRAP